LQIQQTQEQPQVQEPQQSSLNIKSVLESLLFVARKPLAPKDLEEIVSQPKNIITEALEELVSEYDGQGINIIKVAGGYLMGTNADNADFVYNLLHARVKTTLSRQALETLSIIAYKQPITRAEVERIRGVNSDGPIDTLLEKKLIQDLGRSEAVGRPFLYGTTEEFLRHFGLKDLDCLPPQPNSGTEQDALFKSALSE